MKKNILCFITMLLIASLHVAAQDGYSERAKKYIEQYYPLAVAEQKTSGIPASVTLGQGILETEAGASELMTVANNHFGIKCNNGWQGATFSHTDDAPNECFKKYSCAGDSYRDHSLHLKNNPRYSRLFSLSMTDYAAWAVCLKKCGYATNPQYAQQLIKIIEDFELQQYTYSAMDSMASEEFPGLHNKHIKKNRDTVVEPVPEKEELPVADAAVTKTDSTDTVKISDADAIIASLESSDDTPRIVIMNGLRAFYGHKDEMLLSYAVAFNVRYPHLLEMNDLRDGPLPFDMYVYLEKKLTTGTHPRRPVARGESLLMISQMEGIQLKRLIALNSLLPNMDPAEGTVLELQKPLVKKPESQKATLKDGESAAHTDDAIITKSGSADTARNRDYITMNRPKAAPEAMPAAKSSKPVDDGYITIDRSKKAPVRPAVTPAATNPATPGATAGKEKQGRKEETTDKKEDLAGLKADLDKIVYADDSKLPAENSHANSAHNQEHLADNKPAAGSKHYTIRKGDTAFSIAKKNNITVDQLFEWNDINAAGIKIGRTIRVQ